MKWSYYWWDIVEKQSFALSSPTSCSETPVSMLYLTKFRALSFHTLWNPENLVLSEQPVKTLLSFALLYLSRRGLSLNLSCLLPHCHRQFAALRGLSVPSCTLKPTLDPWFGGKGRDRATWKREGFLWSQGRAVCGSLTIIKHINEVTKRTNFLEQTLCQSWIMHFCCYYSLFIEQILHSSLCQKLVCVLAV